MKKNISKFSHIIIGFNTIIILFGITCTPVFSKTFIGAGIVPCAYTPIENNKQEIALLMRYSESKRLWEPFIMEKDTYKKKMLNTFKWLKNNSVYDSCPLDTALRMWLFLPCEYQKRIAHLLVKSYNNIWFNHQNKDLFENPIFLTLFFVPVPFIDSKDLSSYVESQNAPCYEWVLLKDLVAGISSAQTTFFSLAKRQICIEIISLLTITNAFNRKIFTTLEENLKKHSTEPQNIDKHINNPFDIKLLISKKKKKMPIKPQVSTILKNTPQEIIEIDESNCETIEEGGI